MSDQPAAPSSIPEALSCGVIVDDDGRPVLRFIRELSSEADDVWAAISQADQMGRWAFAGDIEPRTGGSVRFGSGADAEEGDVLAWDEPRLLEYQWGEGEERGTSATRSRPASAAARR